MTADATPPRPADLALLPGDVEESLRASLRELLRDRCSPDGVTAMYDGDRSLVAPLWQAVGRDLGLAGLLVAEEHGGAGAGAREAAVVLEELGRAVAPVPFLTSAVLSSSVLAGGGDEASGLLRLLASGERTAALLVPLSAGPGWSGATVHESAGLLTGSVRSVAGALEADLLLVPVATGDGAALYAIDRDRAEVVAVPSLDMSRQLADVALDRVASTVVLADASVALERALLLGAALLASEQVGVARWCLEATVSYLGTRRQFGRVVGGFQALKHRLADVAVSVESASSAAGYAAATAAAGDPDAAVAAHVAQSFCAETAVHAAEECVQLHGGIGMTWEHPAHLYLKRARADHTALGTPARHRARLAGLVHLPEH